jgi:hypothetical protein
VGLGEGRQHLLRTLVLPNEAELYVAEVAGPSWCGTALSAVVVPNVETWHVADSEALVRPRAQPAGLKDKLLRLRTQQRSIDGNSEQSELSSGC